MDGPEIFPPQMLTADAKEDVILLLQRLALPPQRAKELFVQWAQLVGAQFTREEIQRLLGGRPL